MADFTGRDFGRLESKVDAVLANQALDRAERIDHERRLRKVEGRQHWYAGATAVISAVIAFVVPGLKLPGMS